MSETIRNTNEIRDLIYKSLAVAEYSKVPVLFLGNPGIAKTTGVRLWAENFGYKVTTLIGTQRVAEEILGYMVNDTTRQRLITYTPDWYDEIIENQKQGFKTLLFVDELSQAPDNVQGAMLQLIFDRKVGGQDNYLPEDCLVVAAANYKGNIPVHCGIQAPTLNRFNLINVNATDLTNILLEFTQSEEERMENIPVMENIQITDKIEESVRKNVREVMTELINSFARREGEEVLESNNTEFSEMFEQPGEIYNFISGRTISYLVRQALALIHLGLVRKADQSFIQNLVKGLVGLGTNSFKNDRDKLEYEKVLCKSFNQILRNSVEENINDFKRVELSLEGKRIHESIAEWRRLQESLSNPNDDNLKRIVEKIKKEYGTDVEVMTDCLLVKDFNTVDFLNDIQAIEALCMQLKALNVLELKGHIATLSRIIAAYETYRMLAIGSL